MKRRATLGIAAAAMLARAHDAAGQQRRAPVIGLLVSENARAVYTALREALRERGRVDDANLRIETMTWEPWTESGFPARLAVTLTDGTTLRHAVDDVRGGSSRPFPRETILAKFRDNAARMLDAAAVERVIAEIGALETSPTLDGLTAALR